MILSPLPRTRPCRLTLSTPVAKKPSFSTNGRHHTPATPKSTLNPKFKSQPASRIYTALTAGLLSSTGLWWLVSSSEAESAMPSLNLTAKASTSTKHRIYDNKSAGLSKEQVTGVLSENAYSYVVGGVAGLDRYDGAQVASNSPCEDTFLHGRFASPLPSGSGSSSGGNKAPWMAWGIFDGHLGRQTADVLQHELLGYVSRRLNALAPRDQASKTGVANEAIQRAISRGFTDLDEAIFASAMAAASSSPKSSSSSPSSKEERAESLAARIQKMLPVFAGSCALLTLFDPTTQTLHVACTGDSRAVLAQQNPNGTWSTTPLSIDQTGSNAAEIARINAEHPGESSVVRGGRVLGLMVSRAFGDGQWKWPVDVQRELARRFHGPGLLNPKYAVRTPPYITAEPVVTSSRVDTGGAAFVILGSDGLWDFMSSEQAVGLVGAWIEAKSKRRGEDVKDRNGKGVLASDIAETPFDFGQVGDNGVPWGFVEERMTVQDDNVAVHLVRNALGGAHHELLAARLAFQAPHSRRVRDDTTVQVVFFNMENLVRN
ncbi:phosphatase 2C-like domain-containing protein [Aspergillus heterothallicus]